MKLTFKYRLYPTADQRSALERTLEACRWVYNKTLEVRQEAWTEAGESLSRYDTIKLLPEWKAEEPWLQEVYSQLLQEVCGRVDGAFAAFFRRVQAGETPGYPRFKGQGWYKSFTFPQAGSGWKLLDNGRLRLSKIGEVKLKLHRPLLGTVKTLTLKRDRLGNWYACFATELALEPLPPVAGVVPWWIASRSSCSRTCSRRTWSNCTPLPRASVMPRGANWYTTRPAKLRRLVGRSSWLTHATPRKIALAAAHASLKTSRPACIAALTVVLNSTETSMLP